MKPILAILGLSIFLVGCATNKNPVELSQQGPTVKEVLEGHQGVSHAKNNESRFRVFDSDLSHNQIDAHANRRVPNPELSMFVYPRRDPSSGVIIPQYEVFFPMYKQIHYSLRREVGRGVE